MAESQSIIASSASPIKIFKPARLAYISTAFGLSSIAASRHFSASRFLPCLIFIWACTTWVKPCICGSFCHSSNGIISSAFASKNCKAFTGIAWLIDKVVPPLNVNMLEAAPTATPITSPMLFSTAPPLYPEAKSSLICMRLSLLLMPRIVICVATPFSPPG